MSVQGQNSTICFSFFKFLFHRGHCLTMLVTYIIPPTPSVWQMEKVVKYGLKVPYFIIMCYIDYRNAIFFKIVKGGGGAC